MSRLYLRCVICSRQQADGLISSASWGRLDLPTGSAIAHPAVKGTTVRACPSCISDYPDWRERAHRVLGLGTGFGPSQAVSA